MTKPTKKQVASMQSTQIPPSLQKNMETVEIYIGNDEQLEAIQLEYNCSGDRLGAIVKAIGRKHAHMETPIVLIRIARAMLPHKNESYERIPSQLANQTKLDLTCKEYYPLLRSHHEDANTLMVRMVHDPDTHEMPSEGRRIRGCNSFIQQTFEHIQEAKEHGLKEYAMERKDVPNTYAGNPSSLVYNLRRYKQIETKFTQTKTKIKLHW